MRFTLGQRMTIRIAAWCLRHGGSAVELRQALEHAARRRPEEVRLAMWRAVLDRNGIRVG